MITLFRPGLVGFAGRISGRRVQQSCLNMESRLKIFQGIGLSEQKAKETAKNEKLAAQLETIVGKVWRNNTGRPQGPIKRVPDLAIIFMVSAVFSRRLRFVGLMCLNPYHPSKKKKQNYKI